MRKAFAQQVIAQCAQQEYFFLTGDLGFMALEEVRTAFGTRFINCGVAEQNMVSVAAGLSKVGFRSFVYSIAPFCYARPFEQIRNDVGFSRAEVCLVGNGGGYGYGYMGPSHHALEDCAAMCALGLHVLVPAFDTDIGSLLQALSGPCYLRLGQDEHPADKTPPPYAPWRKLLDGERGVMIALGPLAGVAWTAFMDYPALQRPSVWAATELPLAPLPALLCQELSNQHLYVVEEHVRQGGLGMQLLYALEALQIPRTGFTHACANGYTSGRYGSQAFHRAENGLDVQGIRHMTASSACTLQEKR